MSSPDKPPADKPDENKKPYRSPHLYIYGDIRELTAASPAGNKNDGAMGKMMAPRKTFL